MRQMKRNAEELIGKRTILCASCISAFRVCKYQMGGWTIWIDFYGNVYRSLIAIAFFISICQFLRFEVAKRSDLTPNHISKCKYDSAKTLKSSHEAVLGDTMRVDTQFSDKQNMESKWRGSIVGIKQRWDVQTGETTGLLCERFRTTAVP